MADALGLRRTVAQRQALRQTGAQQRGVGGIDGAVSLAPHGHHRAGNDDHIALGGGKRFLQPVMEGHTVYALYGIGGLLPPFFVTDNKKPPDAAGQ